MTAKRIAPTVSNTVGGTIGESAYADAINEEIVGLWRRNATWLNGVAGTVNALTATADVTINEAYQKGQAFWLIPASTNTGGVTLSIDGQSVVDVKSLSGATLPGGQLVAGTLYLLVFDATAFRVVSGGGASSALNSAPDLILRDEKSLNVAGGTFTSGSWYQRDLTVVSRNVLPGSSLLSNQFTLPAGSYYIEWECPAYNVSRHQTRLQNVTDGSSVEQGTTDYTGAVQNASRGQTVVTITSSKVFELDHKCTSTEATDGFGLPANVGTKEVYSQLRVWRVGSLPSQANGVPGGAVTISYVCDLSSTADSDPGSGKLRFNNATQASSTTLYADLLDSTLSTVTPILDTLDVSTSTIKGYLRVSKADDPTRFLTFSLSSKSSPTGYRRLVVNNLASSPSTSPFANGDSLIFSFSPKGDQGQVGNFGNPFYYSTTTTAADPGSGNLRLNNGTLSSATSLFISETDSDANSVASLILGWATASTSAIKGRLKLAKAGAPQNYVQYDFTGALTDNGTWDTLTIVYVNSGGTISNSDNLYVTFTPKGDVGTAVDSSKRVSALIRNRPTENHINTGHLMVDNSVRIFGQASGKFTGNLDSALYSHKRVSYSFPDPVAKFYVTCGTAYALLSSGRVFSWGQNAVGQLGWNGTTNSAVPGEITYFPTNSLVVSEIICPDMEVGGSSNNVLFLCTNGQLYGVGLGTNGQLGDGTSTNRSTPVRCGTLANIVGVSLSSNSSPHVLAWDSSGVLYGWGYQGDNNLGTGSTTAAPSPVTLAPTGVTAARAFFGYGQGAATAAAHSICISSGVIKGCGYNNNGQLGLSNTTTPITTWTTASAITGTPTPVSLFGTNSYTGGNSGFISSAGDAYMTGFNAGGQCGQGNTTSPLQVFTKVTGLPAGQVTAVFGMGAMNGYNWFAAIANSRLYSWGNGAYYQTGQGDVPNISTPTLVPMANVFSSQAPVDVRMFGYANSGGLGMEVLFADGRVLYCGQQSTTGFGTKPGPNYAAISETLEEAIFH